MKIPRDLTADHLIKQLRSLGYEKTRQSGSHIRLTTLNNGEHHITIPNHKPLRIGTLASILADVAEHLQISKEQLYQRIF